MSVTSFVALTATSGIPRPVTLKKDHGRVAEFWEMLSEEILDRIGLVSGAWKIAAEAELIVSENVQ